MSAHKSKDMQYSLIGHSILSNELQAITKYKNMLREVYLERKEMETNTKRKGQHIWEKGAYNFFSNNFNISSGTVNTVGRS